MIIIIDRVEADYAVAELPDKRIVNFPIALLPPDAKEGSVIRIELDQSATRRRKGRIDKLMNDLWENE